MAGKGKAGRPKNGVKYGGRVKGTPNKVTTMTKEVIASMLTEYQQSGLLAKDFAELEPKDRMYIFDKLLNYALPKMQSVSADVSVSEQERRISDRLADLIEDVVE